MQPSPCAAPLRNEEKWPKTPSASSVHALVAAVGSSSRRRSSGKNEYISRARAVNGLSTTPAAPRSCNSQNNPLTNPAAAVPAGGVSFFSHNSSEVFHAPLPALSRRIASDLGIPSLADAFDLRRVLVRLAFHTGPVAAGEISEISRRADRDRPESPLSERPEPLLILKVLDDSCACPQTVPFPDAHFRVFPTVVSARRFRSENAGVSPRGAGDKVPFGEPSSRSVFVPAGVPRVYGSRSFGPRFDRVLAPRMPAPAGSTTKVPK